MFNQEEKQDVVYFGRTNFRGANKLFGIKRTDRRQHMYVIGKTGTGKSALLHNLIIQDIANGEGLCVVDPHGELVEGILEKIPEQRINDVIYFNPADTEYHIGFNVLELPDPKYKHLVASGLMGIFTKIWANVWSARMEYILNNAILALLDTPNSTLMGINRILTDKEYRQKIIANIKDPVVRAFWVNEYEEWRDQFRNEAIAPIQNKVGQFLSTDIIRNVVCQTKSTINIFDIMNQGKILLINVSKGKIGEDNSALLGAMFITKIQMAAMERVRIPEEERVDFYLYVDEFQNFATESFAGILSEARKYRLNLILAHQYVGQLVTDVSTRVRDAIFGNVGTMIVFRIGAKDAEFLEKEFAPEFSPEDMVNLPNYHIYLKMVVDGVSYRPFSATTLPPFKTNSSVLTKEKIIENSRKKYGKPHYLVEEEIKQFTSGSTEPSLELNLNDLKKDEKYQKRKTKEVYAPELALLGIEFELKSEKNKNQPKPKQQLQNKKEVQDLKLNVANLATQNISLKDLKPEEKLPKYYPKKESVDINDLKESIRQSLSDSENDK
ncbi:MAG: type IV secretory system conjugative DNA transfer family protein [Minisyncoccia bacterium]